MVEEGEKRWAEDAAVQQMKEKLLAAVERDFEDLARLMVSKPDGELFGKTEFEVRDLVHRMGRKALELSANERLKKGGTAVLALLAPAENRRSSSIGGRRP